MGAPESNPAIEHNAARGSPVPRWRSTRRKLADRGWHWPCCLSATPGPLVRKLSQSLTARRTDVKRQSRCETKSIAPEQIETLIIQLSGRVRLLDSDIEAEEERTRCKDRRDAGYSILSRTLIARRDNLSATITALRERLAALEAPEWNYS